MNTQDDSKNIILCSDGTGQSGGVGKNTNVWRIYNAVDIKHKDKKQLTFYDDGVGTNEIFILKAMGLAFGLGLSKNIRELYKFAVMHYKPNDKLYLFGFSRGSHTIRLLAEFICTFGIINPKSYETEIELDQAILALQKQFKAVIRKAWKENSRLASKTNPSQLLRGLLDKVLPDKIKRKQQTVPQIFDKVEIEFIGVWDTVSAVGMPIEEMRNNIFFAQHAFVDNKLHENVQHASQALAIDEKRQTFKPELWNQKDEKDPLRIKQVWFSGVHTNVGGGYPKDQLSFISLEWMMKEASNNGLIFRESIQIETSQQGNHNGTMYDSRSGLAAFYRYKPRNIQELTDKFYPKSQSKPNIHVSAYQRIKDSSASYSPVNLPLKTAIVSNDYTQNEAYSEKTALAQQLCYNLVSEANENKTNNSIDIEKPENNPWNIIWWQRVLHLVFMLFFAAFITMGINLTNNNPTIDITSDYSPIRALLKILNAINNANPFYITKELLPGYVNNADVFWLMFIIFMFILIVRYTLKKHHDNIGNILWNRPPFDENRVNAKRLHSGFALNVCMSIANFFRNRIILNKKILPFCMNKLIPLIMDIFLLATIFLIILNIFKA